MQVGDREHSFIGPVQRAGRIADEGGAGRARSYYPLVPAKAGTPQLDPRLRGNERRKWRPSLHGLLHKLGLSLCE